MEFLRDTSSPCIKNIQKIPGAKTFRYFQISVASGVCRFRICIETAYLKDLKLLICLSLAINDLEISLISLFIKYA